MAWYFKSKKLRYRVHRATPMCRASPGLGSQLASSSSRRARARVAAASAALVCWTPGSRSAKQSETRDAPAAAASSTHARSSASPDSGGR